MVESFVFTCSTGRCGTAYLARLFDGKHEPQPKLMEADNALLSTLIRDVAANGNEAAARAYMSNIKLPHIERNCNRRVYLETAHTFSKGFLRSLIEILGPKLKIVRLRRKSTEVVSSLLRLGTIPPAGGWYLRGTDAICVDRIPEDEWSRFSEHEKCNWYVKEIENQWSQRIKPCLSESQRFEVDLSEILSDNRVLRELESFLELPLVIDRVGERVNARR